MKNKMNFIILVLGFYNLAICASNIILPRSELGIIHGQEARAHSKPYQIYLEVEYTWFRQYCSGVLITSKHVITTARCVVGSDSVNVIAGAHNVKNYESSRVMVVSTDYRIFDKYDYDFGYNIALVKLSEPLPLNQYISVIEMNLTPGNLLGKMVQISGWGGESYQHMESTVLREASAVFVNASVCIAHQFEMSETDVCLSGINGATICFADAGGPVVLDGELIAVLSPKEYECGRWRSFSAVELSKYSNWLDKELSDF